MMRRGQQRKNDERKAHRDALDQVESQQGDYVPPDRDDCDLRAWEVFYDEANTLRAQFYQWRLDGRLADFVVDLQRLELNGWEPVERIDCCHGHCHLHRRDGSTQTIRRLDHLEDVALGYREVEDLTDDRMRTLRT